MFPALSGKARDDTCPAMKRADSHNKDYTTFLTTFDCLVGHSRDENLFKIA